MKRWFLLAGLVLGVVWPARAADEAGSVAGPKEPAPLVVWNREIMVFRATVGNATPQQRMDAALVRLRAVPDLSLFDEIQTETVTVGPYRGVAFDVGGIYLFVLVEGDLEPGSGVTLEEAAQEVQRGLEAVRDAKRAQRSPAVIAKGAGISAAATAGFVLGVWLLWAAQKGLQRLLVRSMARWKVLRFKGLDLRQVLLQVVRRLLTVLFTLLTLAGAYVWVVSVLSQFPYTAPWSGVLGQQVREVAEQLSDSVVRAIPGLLVAVLLLLLTRWTARLASVLLKGLETSREERWMSGDTARATRRIVVVLVWIAGIVVAYPYIPGSDSQAFKGIGVLLGLMVSLGSTGMVNQVMSGFVILYSRAVRTGEYAQLGDVEGTVVEIGLLSTKVLTPRNEFVTVPNAVLIGHKTTNFSRMQGEQPTELATGVTIGYDVPWRQVQALLLLAAERTPGVRKDPAPRVLQTALSDFYVEYSLRFVPENMQAKSATLSQLHERILDAFNEFGVQIMSPHFEYQPEGAVLVPKERWSLPPVEQPAGDGKGLPGV